MDATQADTQSGDDVQCLDSMSRMTLELPPSSVQFCPTFPDWFVVGTYSLEESKGDGPETHDKSNEQEEGQELSTQKRSGTLVLIHLDGHILNTKQTYECPSAVLDVKFSPQTPDVFAVALSTGLLSLFRIGLSPSETCEMIHMSTHRVDSPSVLVLSLGWYDTSRESDTIWNDKDAARWDDRQLIGVTLSTGHSRLIPVVDGLPSMERSQELPRHSEAVWTIALYSFWHCFGTAMTGGDDATVAISHFNAPSFEVDPSQLFSGLHYMRRYHMLDEPFHVPKIHHAGVTAVLPIRRFFLEQDGDGPGTAPWQDLILTGSFDEYVRIVDITSSDSTKVITEVLAELRLGGGVWRLSPVQRGRPEMVKDAVLGGDVQFHVLASCMHAGARILQIDCKTTDGRTGEWNIKVLATFEEHQSLCYASDAKPGPGAATADGSESIICASSSFYDKLLCVWEFKLPGGRDEDPSP